MHSSVVEYLQKEIDNRGTSQMAVLSETSEMHLASFLIFSQCDNGGVCVCCVCTRMCVYFSVLAFLPSLLFGAKGFHSQKSPGAFTPKLHAFSHFCLIWPVYSVFPFSFSC